MKQLLYLIFGICLSAGITSCHMHGDDSHTHDDGHNHEQEDVHAHLEDYPSATYTAWTDKTELFVEYPVLAVGNTSKFAVYFSSMQSFKPLAKGICKVELVQNGVVVEDVTVNSPRSPGIFTPEITPSKSGIYNLVFYITSESLRDTIISKNVIVYESEDDARHKYISPDERDAISFSKEQAWKIDFALAPVRRANIQNIIRTSGEVLRINSDESSVSATTSGIVTFKNSSLREGQNITKGASLFVVNNDKVVSANLSEKYAIAKANMEKSQKNLERSKGLVDSGIISQKEYDERNRQYEVDRAGYETLTSNYSVGGMTMRAPISGILKRLNIVNGQYVTEGQTIATISRNKNLIIEAEVSQQYYLDVPNIVSANIKLPWSDQIVGIAKYNGELVKQAIIAKDHYIPVLFKIDNTGGIVPGTYLDIYLKTNKTRDGLVIPKNALLREYDMYFVYVMVSGELFEKRMVKIEVDDGEMVEVTTGLDIGEMIVTKGVYAIKMASMSSSIPAHGHEH